MNRIEHGHHQHGDPNGGNIQSHRPYWTRAHRDWRVWVGVVLMLTAMIIYLATGDLAWGPHIHSQQPLLGATGK
ncbi:MAG TPA: hypothetical protein VMR33_20455 [Candidatus Baltobacteraceae bacterium]|jgi:hypothetical protein|nr:hypothetical protein [Candidatus Baltobacteraceae bacterium]